MSDGKRIDINKYIRCSCQKHQKILVGIKAYKYSNILGLVVIPPVIVLLVLAKDPFAIGIALILTAIVILVPLSIYRGTMKRMLQLGHTQQCSKRVALLEITYHGRYSSFKIIEDDEAPDVNKK